MSRYFDNRTKNRLETSIPVVGVAFSGSFSGSFQGDGTVLVPNTSSFANIAGDTLSSRFATQIRLDQLRNDIPFAIMSLGHGNIPSTLVIPSGSYTITASVNLPPNVNILGDNAPIITVSGSSGFVIGNNTSIAGISFLSGPANASIFSGLSTTNVNLTNISLTGGSTLISASLCTDIVVNSVNGFIDFISSSLLTVKNTITPTTSMSFRACNAVVIENSNAGALTLTSDIFSTIENSLFPIVNLNKTQNTLFNNSQIGILVATSTSGTVTLNSLVPTSSVGTDSIFTLGGNSTTSPSVTASGSYVIISSSLAIANNLNVAGALTASTLTGDGSALNNLPSLAFTAASGSSGSNAPGAQNFFKIIPTLVTSQPVSMSYVTSNGSSGISQPMASTPTVNLPNIIGSSNTTASFYPFIQPNHSTLIELLTYANPQTDTQTNVYSSIQFGIYNNATNGTSRPSTLISESVRQWKSAHDENIPSGSGTGGVISGTGNFGPLVGGQLYWLGVAWQLVDTVPTVYSTMWNPPVLPVYPSAYGIPNIQPPLAPYAPYLFAEASGSTGHDEPVIGPYLKAGLQPDLTTGSFMWVSSSQLVNPLSASYLPMPIWYATYQTLLPGANGGITTTTTTTTTTQPPTTTTIPGTTTTTTAAATTTTTTTTAAATTTTTTTCPAFGQLLFCTGVDATVTDGNCGQVTCLNNVLCGGTEVMCSQQ